MIRREFITLLGGAVVVWPLAMRAQQPAMPMVGFLHVGSANPFTHLVAGFRQGLKEIGYVESQNVTIEFRWADGQYDRLPALAADLVRRRAAVILTGGGEAPISAVRAASLTVPIEFNIGNDPVKLGIVASLGRPSGNSTGVNILTAELPAKRWGLLYELAPASSVVAVLVNPNFLQTDINVKELEVAARVVGRQIQVLKARNESEIDAAFAAISPPTLLARADEVIE
jgi:putative ABC transport system substrate-binding protein